MCVNEHMAVHRYFPFVCMKMHEHLDLSAAGSMHALRCVSLIWTDVYSDMIMPNAAAAPCEVAILTVS